MKISRKWLEDYVDIDVVSPDASTLADALTMLGLAVELVEEVSGDAILDVDVTTNRPDCLNHYGIARELAAYYRLDLKHPEWGDLEADSVPEEGCSAGVTILDADLCSRYAARVMWDVEIGESPDWLKTRLESIGQRAINNIVDITNYVLFELGHPLHAFDYHRLTDRQIVVRRAKPGETLVTLDGIERKLREDMLVIADASHPVALAGIMGGADSEIGPETKVLLLESAWFQPSSVRSTAGSLGMRTEASYRFERGADLEMPVRALNRTCRLIKEIAGGRIVGPLIDEYPGRETISPIQLRKKRIVHVSGVEIDGQDVEETLRRLEFDVKPSGDGSWTVRPPSFRHDIELEDDLVEEVVRHYGYDRIPVIYPRPEDAGQFQKDEPSLERIISILKGNGFWEAMNWVFTTPDRLKPFFGDEVSAVQISNPLSEADTHLRVSLVPGIVESLRRNLYRGNQDVRLFEIGNVFFLGEDGQNREERRLGLG
ncbi:MAG TPA: phenylalanine--tRNA ligase subunit beta, partial [Acidobacteriota bacterium]|nr:phenylalanine--tRNA ligase subunit beta [Acidobacteriota bacterium]